MLVTIIADASWCPETRAGGYGFWAVANGFRAYGGGPLRLQPENNNAAEMMALVNALHRAIREGLVEEGDQILAQTDCTAAILGFTGKRRLGEQEAGVVARMQELCGKHGLTIEYRHVPGHTKGLTPRTWVNNVCDQYAKEGMRKARKRLSAAYNR